MGLFNKNSSPCSCESQGLNEWFVIGAVGQLEGLFPKQRNPVDNGSEVSSLPTPLCSSWEDTQGYSKKLTKEKGLLLPPNLSMVPWVLLGQGPGGGHADSPVPSARLNWDLTHRTERYQQREERTKSGVLVRTNTKCLGPSPPPESQHKSLCSVPSLRNMHLRSTDEFFHCFHSV